MATFKRISELPVAETIEDSDLLILETATGTKAVTREILKGETSISKEDVGLGNVDNTSDLNKPISTATQTALNAKVDTTTLTSNYSTNAQIASTYLAQNTASGTYLSKTDAAAAYVLKSSHTTDLATKQDVINDLASIRSGASAGATALQPGGLADVATSGSYTDLIDKPTYSTVASTGSYNDLLNKPSLANVATSGSYSDLTGKPIFATVATSGAYSDLTGKPTIPDAQIQADWSEADDTKKDYIKNKPSLHAVATSGSYNDLINKPTLSAVAASGSYTDLFNKPAIPSKVSDLDNDTGYITGIAWNDVANKPVDFTPSTHSHTVSQITDFPTLPVITDTYSSSSSDGMSGKAVASAISGKADSASSLSGYGILDAYTKTEVDGKISAVYKPAGSAAFTSLPTPGSTYLGNVYNVTDAFTTDSRFVEGEGGSYPAGTNVVIVNTTGTTYKFDVLAGFVDLSGYVPTSRTVNSKALTSNITLSHTDVGAAASSHGHEGSEVTLTGYEKASSASAVVATDTVNEALGKIEKALDGKQASGSYAAAVHSHATSDVSLLTSYSKGSDATALASTDTLNEALSKLENQIDGKQASGSYAPATHTHVGSAVTLTGYEKASSASAVTTTDTVNEAIGKIEKALDGKQASGSYAAAVHTHVGSDTVLTGYEKASLASAVATTDTVNQAIGKLEKALDGKQASGTYLDTTSTYNTLNTSNKTIIGAINEVNGYLSGLEALLAEI